MSDFPTFGGEDGRLCLQIQSLDRKGELTNDRHKVLIDRAPRRHRSITALNFFTSPPPSEVPPVPALPSPVPASSAPKRPPPRFLEVFTPLSDDNAGLASSNVSTPSTRLSSLPVTPSTPRKELGRDAPRKANSYFLLVPQHHHERPPAAISRSSVQLYSVAGSDVTPEAGEEEWQQHADDRPKADEELTESAHSDRSLAWGTIQREPPRIQEPGNALMMDGTFGRM